MQKYSEVEGKEVFDWHAFLATQTHTSGEWVKASALAANWVTCACGQLCSIIPRDVHTGAPLDVRLGQLGDDFSEAIAKGLPMRARDILAQIEVRSAELILEIENQ